MSYSFIVTADTKADAKQRVADQFDNVVSAQAAHKADRDPAVACAQAFIDTLAEPQEGHEIQVSMHGSVGWHHEHGEYTPKELLHASVGLNAQLRAKPKVV